MMLEAVKVALDPTPRQERLLESHAGAARFAYNAGLAHVKDALEAGEKTNWSHYSLRKWWNANKDVLAVNQETGEAWWPRNSKEAYSYGFESLANALRNFTKSRKELVKLFVFGVCFINRVPFVRGMRPRVGRGPVSSW